MCKLLHNTGEPLPQDSTEDYLPSTLIEAARELEFDYIACGWRPPLPISAPKITIKSNYPNVWSERYVEAGYIKRDPTISASQKSLRPIAWTDELFSKARDLWGEAQDIGLKFGCAQSIRDGRGNRSMVTLARTHEPISQAEIQQALSRLAQGRTVVMIAHRLSTVTHADQILVLDQGRIIGQGTHSALLSNCPLYQRLWHAQHSQALSG